MFMHTLSETIPVILSTPTGCDHSPPGCAPSQMTGSWSIPVKSAPWPSPSPSANSFTGFREVREKGRGGRTPAGTDGVFNWIIPSAVISTTALKRSSHHTALQKNLSERERALHGAEPFMATSACQLIHCFFFLLFVHRFFNMFRTPIINSSAFIPSLSPSLQFPLTAPLLPRHNLPLFLAIVESLNQHPFPLSDLQCTPPHLFSFFSPFSTSGLFAFCVARSVQAVFYSNWSAASDPQPQKQTADWFSECISKRMLVVFPPW